MRLGGTLNQIRLRCPRWIADCEVPWHLKEWLFHWVWKYVRDSIRYLYGNCETTYSELVTAAHQAESEMEETKERVKARSAASTEVVSGSKELGDQIARLMAALTRVEQGSHPASAPNSPRHRSCGRGQADRNTPICPSSHNGQTWPGSNGFCLQFLSCKQRKLWSSMKGEYMDIEWCTGWCSEHKGLQLVTMLQMPDWGHMARECTTPAKTLNQDRGTKGNAVKPPSSNNQ